MPEKNDAIQGLLVCFTIIALFTSQDFGIIYQSHSVYKTTESITSTVGHKFLY
jgi:hypothetical protein